MSDNGYTVIITGEFNPGGMQRPEFKEYSEKAGAILAADGGTVLNKFGVEQNLGDGNAPHVVLVVSFPSKEKAIETFTSEAYQNIIPLRKVAVKAMNLLITK
jgi:uncharacterized protein (DUF1330 family)